MSLKILVMKIIHKMIYYICRKLNRDPTSFIIISHRSDLSKIGTDYGGWVISTSLINSNSICYCFGCGEDISFDLGLIELFGCNVYGFDPTPRAIQYVRSTAGNNLKYHFSEIGLWEKEDYLKFYVPQNKSHISHSLLNLQKTDTFIKVKVDRLKKIMDNNKHNMLDLLKIDIEGAEYAVIDSIIADNLYIKIICVEYDEYHHPLDCNYRKRIRASAKKMVCSGYSLVDIRGGCNYTFIKNI